MSAVLRPVISEVSSADFRSAMRHLTGGVSIVTAGRGREISGMTVTSVTSLSADPAALIVGINRDASSFPFVKRYGAFGVNILGADQIAIAERFAGKGGLKGAERFAEAQWTTGVSGVPLLADALAALDCELEEIIERHSHGIIVGSLLSFELAPRLSGLVYWNGQYIEIDPDNDLGLLAEVSIPLTHVR